VEKGNLVVRIGKLGFFFRAFSMAWRSVGANNEDLIRQLKGEPLNSLRLMGVACRSAMDLIFIFPTLDILFTYNK